MISERPNFLDSPYFVMEVGNWHLKPNAPKEVVEEFNAFMRQSVKKSKDFTIAKSDDDQRLVFGWANVARTADGQVIKDWQEDTIEPEELEKAAYEYVLNFRATGERHNPALRNKGRLVESVVLTKEKQQAMGIPEGFIDEAWWVGFYIDDDKAWEGIKKGDYQMFSIEGQGKREKMEKSRKAKGYISLRGKKRERKTIRKAMTYAELKKFNPYHGKDGRFTSASGATSFTYKPSSKAGAKAIEREKKRLRAEEDAKIAPNGLGTTKIDMNDLKGGAEHHSLAKYIDENGNLTPEREELHKEIVRKFLDGVEKVPEGEQQTFYMLGGGSGAGKSTVRKSAESGMPDDKKAVTVDADAVKGMLPEYQQMVKAGDSRAAAFAHEESSALAKRINTVAQENNYHVVYDGTGDGSVGSVMKKLNEAKANGLVTEGLYVTIPPQVAKQRAEQRFQRTGRRVPDSVIEGTHRGVSKILPEVAEHFDNVRLFSNIDKPRLIAQGGNGKKLTAIDEGAYQDFLAIANG